MCVTVFLFVAEAVMRLSGLMTLCVRSLVQSVLLVLLSILLSSVQLRPEIMATALGGRAWRSVVA